MADEALWARRVAEWKASGEPSTTFTEGRDFSASALRYWAKRLERKRGAPPRIARLVRDELVAEERAGGEVVVEVGGVRVTIGRDFDRATLRAVVEVLRELGGSR
jgi:transposase